MSIRISPDTRAIIALIALWLLFFWRLFTPIAADQASLKQGDFSGQFVAFGGYQYARWSQGEVPLWNPYNNGGLPFIADTQAAVFYPPRLVTIALASITGTGWTYHALQLEMTFHVLFYTLAMYLFVRRMTGRPLAGVVAAIIGGYGGYMSGYPPLQLALLEAGVWLPLALLGIYESTRVTPIRWTWLILTGWALGLSWLAGHPQTSFFLTYLLIAYFIYRTYRFSWRVWAIGIALFGVIAVGVVAVTLLPGLEYLLLTSRSDLGFEAKSGGFPLQDLIQLVFPGVVSLFSPLYVGIVGLTLALIALWRKAPNALFWGAVALFALILSFGGNTALFDAIYNLIPGLRFFRGQERAAYLIAHSLAILAGLGIAYLIDHVSQDLLKRTRLILAVLQAICSAIALLLFIAWIGDRDLYSTWIAIVIFTALITFALIGLLSVSMPAPTRWILIAILLVFELFSVNLDHQSSYDPIPASAQLQRSPLLDPPLADRDLPFRVDGLRVLGANYGSLYGIADIHGISPLFLTGVQAIVEYGLPDEIAWELFSVRYVYSDWQALPVPGVVLAEGTDSLGPVRLHQLTAPRPYAHLLYQYVIVENDTVARQRLADPAFNPREIAILHQEIALDLPEARPTNAGATITRYQPEQLTIVVDSPTPAILSLAHVDYPGWQATINGQPTPILRAYGGLMALTVPAGIHEVNLVFNPLSYQIGAILSLVTWLALIILTGILVVRRLTKRNSHVD